MQAIRLCAFLLCATAWAWGHDSEPINTEFASPFALQSGNIQFGFQHFRDLESFNVVAIELEYGFAPRMQFSLIFPLTRLDDGENMHVRPGNIELGFRYLLAGGSNRRFAVSANAEAGLPTGDKQVSERAYELGGAIHIDTHPAARVWTHTNLGYETPVARFEEKEKSFFYRFAVMYEATEELRPVLELVGVHDFESEETQTAIVPELIVAPAKHWEIKAGLPLGITASTPDVGIQFQLTWKFGSIER